MAKRKPTSRPRGSAPQKRAAPPPPAPAPRGPGPGTRALATLRRFSFLIVLLVAVAGGIALGVSNGSDEGGEEFGDATSTATTEAPFQSNQEDVKGQPVKEVFAHTCGTCHTLSAAGVTGIAGPNLDRIALTSTRVRDMIRTGSLDSAMPKNLLEGEDADRVARYVARVSRASRAARARE